MHHQIPNFKKYIHFRGDQKSNFVSITIHGSITLADVKYVGK